MPYDSSPHFFSVFHISQLPFALQALSHLTLSMPSWDRNQDCPPLYKWRMKAQRVGSHKIEFKPKCFWLHRPCSSTIHQSFSFCTNYVRISWDGHLKNADSQFHTKSNKSELLEMWPKNLHYWREPADSQILYGWKLLHVTGLSSPVSGSWLFQLSRLCNKLPKS